MALDFPIIGAFNAIYVGDADTSDVLVQLGSDTTGGYRIEYNCPQEYHEATGWIQSDRAMLDITLAFNEPTEETTQLAMGNLPDSGEFPDKPPDFVKLAIFLIHPMGDDERLSIYIPLCVVDKKWVFEAFKDKNTINPIKFLATDNNRFNELVFRRTNSELDTVMGVRSPL